MAEPVAMELARLQEKVEGIQRELARYVGLQDEQVADNRRQFAEITGSLNRIENQIGQDVKVLQTKHLVLAAIFMALLQIAALAVAAWGVLRDNGRRTESDQRSAQRLATGGAALDSRVGYLRQETLNGGGQDSVSDRVASAGIAGERD